MPGLWFHRLPEWRNWSYARHSKCRVLRDMWVRLPPPAWGEPPRLMSQGSGGALEPSIACDGGLAPSGSPARRRDLAAAARPRLHEGRDQAPAPARTAAPGQAAGLCGRKPPPRTGRSPDGGGARLRGGRVPQPLELDRPLAARRPRRIPVSRDRPPLVGAVSIRPRLSSASVVAGQGPDDAKRHPGHDAAVCVVRRRVHRARAPARASHHRSGQDGARHLGRTALRRRIPSRASAG